MKNSWFDIRAEAEKTDTATISIFGDIGEGGVTAENFIQNLQALGAVKNIEIFINSYGGDFFQANAIYNFLKSYDAEITVGILGIAASAASVISMAGKKVFMPESSFLFVHNAQALVVGEEKDMIEMADALRKISGAIAHIYAQKSGKSDATARASMNDATWFTAQEAKDAGLCDEVTEAMDLAADAGLRRFANHANLPAPLFMPSFEKLVASQTDNATLEEDLIMFLRDINRHLPLAQHRCRQDQQHRHGRPRSLTLRAHFRKSFTSQPRPESQLSRATSSIAV